MAKRIKRPPTTPNKFRDELKAAMDKHGPLLPTGIAADYIGISRQSLYQLMTRHRLVYIVVRTPKGSTHNLIPFSTCREIVNERKTRQQYIYGSGYHAVDKPPIGGSVEISVSPATNAKAKPSRKRAAGQA